MKRQSGLIVNFTMTFFGHPQSSGKDRKFLAMTESDKSNLTVLEKRVLEMILQGDEPVLRRLRQQSDAAQVASREFTGAGFYTNLVFTRADLDLEGAPDFELGDVAAKVPGLNYGAGFVLFVRGGRLAFLEGFSYDEPWPETMDDCELSHQVVPRIRIRPRTR